MKGMQKIKRGTGFKGVLGYALENKKGDSPGRIVGGNMLGTTIESLNREFAKSRRLRKDIEKPVWHNSLRLPKGENLADEKLKFIGEAYMKKMGFDDLHQKVFVLHDDPEGQHIHIIASRISLESQIYLGQNENLKSTRHIQDLEKEFGLTITKGSSYIDGKIVMPDKSKIKKSEIEKSIRTGKAPDRLILQKVIDEVILGNPSIIDFVKTLGAAGVDVKPNIASTGKMNGFSFCLSNQDKSDKNIWFSGSKLGQKYKWGGLLKEGLGYEKERDTEFLLGLKNEQIRQSKRDVGVSVVSNSEESKRNKGNSSIDRRDEPEHGFVDTGESGVVNEVGRGEKSISSDMPGESKDKLRDSSAIKNDSGNGIGSDEIDRSSGKEDQYENDTHNFNISIDNLRGSVNSLSDLAAPVKRRTEDGDVVVQKFKSGESEKSSGSGPMISKAQYAKVAGWRKQHGVLQCEKYRITLKGRQGKVAGVAWNLGNKDREKSEKGWVGEEIFWNADEVEKKIPFLSRQNMIGFDVYITPIDDDHHYLLIDDSNKENLEILRKTGFIPNIVQETSKNNLQLIYKVERDKSRVDEQSIANSLMLRLNKNLGDEDISGANHAFRIPGFSNKKPGKNNAFTVIDEINFYIKGSRMSQVFQGMRDDKEKKKVKRPVFLTNTDVKPNESASDRYLYWLRRFVGLAKAKFSRVDNSSIDFRAAKEMLLEEYNKEQIRLAMATHSEHLKNHPKDDVVRYVERTVDAAELKVEEEIDRRMK